MLVYLISTCEVEDFVLCWVNAVVSEVRVCVPLVALKHLANGQNPQNLVSD